MSSAETPIDPLIGRTFAQYEVVAKLGGGGMGVVYKARDSKLGRFVALKFLPTEWSHDEAAKQRFVREAQAASATNHRNICVIHNIEESTDGRLFIVMAYYEGETLKRRLESGPLPIADAIDVGMEVAEGLAKAHAQGVVHRDVKPGNLIVTDDGVKILDFGLAKFADALQLTAPGSTIGTYAYMAPEQVRGEDATERSDVWALGVVMYEMLTGAPPFHGTYPEAMFHAIKYEPLPLMRTVRPEVPEPLERIVAKALEKDTGARYQSAREMARDLRLLAGRTVPLELRTEALPAVGAHPLRAQVVAQPRRGRRLLWFGASAAVVLLAAAAAFIWRSRPMARVRVAITPVANHTGVTTLDRYRLALTDGLIGELSESPNIRVVPYIRLLEMVRPFTGPGADMSGSEAVHAVATASGAPFVVVPTLTYRDRDASWLMQIQIRNAETGTTVASYETPPVNSALSEQTAFRLVTAAAAEIQTHFKAQRGGRSYSARPASSRFREPEAARRFADGLDAYEQLEYRRASDELAAAAALDPQHALTHAWSSRVSWLLGARNDASAAAQRAKALVSNETSAHDAAFINAVLVESQGDMALAERAYQALSVDNDEPWTRLELADFLKRRQDRNQEAIETYHEVLKADPLFVRPHVDLCQLYTRVDDHPLAEREAHAALDRFRASGAVSGEAQALLCLAEEQRKQSGTHLADARSNAEEARRLFASLGHGFNLARAEFYKASVEYSDGRLADAAALFRSTADSLGANGNRALQGVALMNVGSIRFQLGQPTQALEGLRRGRQVFLEIGDERRAAEADVNLAGVQNDYGIDPAGTARLVANARVTLERLGYVEFVLLAMLTEADSHRYAARLDRARVLLRSASEIAGSRGLAESVDNLSIALARADTQAGDYQQALAPLERIVQADGAFALEARIALGALLTHLGEFDRARSLLRQAVEDSGSQQRNSLQPLARGALARVALEMGDRQLARSELNAAVESWVDPLPNAAVVEARCDRGLEKSRDGGASSASAEVVRGIDEARQLGRVVLEARCRIQLARIYLNEQRREEAAKVLAAIPSDGGEMSLGPELRAEVEHWRAETVRRTNVTEAEVRQSRARALIESIQASLSAESRNRYAARTEIQTILRESAYR